MNFEPRTIVLKHDKVCTLRPTSPGDAAEMIAYMKDTAAETPFLLRYPDEINYTLEQEQEILGHLLQDERTVMMLAEVDGRVAGNLSISPLGNKRRILHRCSLAIALRKEFWHLGIGTAMINFAISLAQKIGYEQMELGVADGNGAKQLYLKVGFTETGRHYHALKFADGTYRDEIIMCRIL